MTTDKVSQERIKGDIRQAAFRLRQSRQNIDNDCPAVALYRLADAFLALRMVERELAGEADDRNRV